MKKFLATLILVSSVLYAPQVFAFGGCEQDCLKCHSLNKEEVQQIFTKLQVPEAQVMDIKMSPIGGLWEVTLDNKGQRGIMYVGFSKKHIVGGPIFDVDTASNKSRETLQQVNKEVPRYVERATISLDNALVMGDANASHKVVVFTDPDCPYCGKLHTELKKVLSERKDIAFYIKLMPLPMHPEARWKAQTMLCSNSIKLLEDNFEGKPVPKPDCDTKGIDENIKLAQSLGITGTPTLVMPDGMVVSGARDAKTIMDLVTNPPAKQESK